MIVLYALAGGAVALALFAAYVATRPAEFRIERSATVPAPPRAVFDQVNDFRNWAAWSPWAELDPNMRLDITSPSAGVGAGYAWEGNKQAGKGWMTITDSRPGEFVGIDLHFEKPIRADNRAEFTFTPAAGGTTVRWVMTGKKNFLFKAFHLLVDVDKMVGRDFEKGLTSLRAVVENPPARRAA